MPNLTGKIGNGCPNNVHDVTLVQAMFGLIRNPKGQLYVGSYYDGVLGGHTKAAITAFQSDRKTSVAPNVVFNPAFPYMVKVPGTSKFQSAPFPDHQGNLEPGNATIRAMNDSLPKDYADILVARGTRVVYWPDSPADAVSTAAAIESDASLNSDFRKNVATLVRRMYDRYKIVLSIEETRGGVRTFQQQYIIATTPDANGVLATGAGPGESNHNYGKGVDLGYDQFEWLHIGGTSIMDDSWLNKLTQLHPGRHTDMWKLRNAIAFGELGMSPSKKTGDLIHIQQYSDDHVSMVKSLAALLDKVGDLSWRQHGPHSNHYDCDLGFAGTWHDVGTAVQIWSRTGPMEKHWLAAGQGVPVSSIKDSDVKAKQDALRADFEAAETDRDQWQPVNH